jgi:hypothetical protein
MLDAYLKFGTLAERTSKQPGRARHITTACNIFTESRGFQQNAEAKHL